MLKKGPFASVIHSTRKCFVTFEDLIRKNSKRIASATKVTTANVLQKLSINSMWISAALYIPAYQHLWLNGSVCAS